MWDAASTEQFETITGSPRSLLFVDMDRAACLPPLPSAAACHDRILLRRILPVLGDPRLVYLVHSMDSLRDLIRDLSAFPGDVRFLDGRIASLADLAGGDRAEEDLREVLALAKSVTCESDWLRGRIGELIERESVCVRADFAGAIRQAS